MFMLGKILAAMLLPPFIIFLLIALGLLMLRRAPRGARCVLVFSAASLYLFAMPFTGALLLWTLESDPPLPAVGINLRGEQAIVVLGGGLYRGAPEYGGDSIHGGSLERVRYGARLARATSLPLLVTGGSVFGDGRPEARAMKQALEEEFGVPVRWVEDASRNTAENARNTHDMLVPARVQRIFLVTHASHMRRSRAIFEQSGFIVTAAGTDFVHWDRPTVFDFLPNARALNDSAIAMHEWIGLLWYRYAYDAK